MDFSQSLNAAWLTNTIRFVQKTVGTWGHTQNEIIDTDTCVHAQKQLACTANIYFTHACMHRERQACAVHART